MVLYRLAALLLVALLGCTDAAPEHKLGSGAIPPYGPAGGGLSGVYPNPHVNLAADAGYVNGPLPVADLAVGAAGAVQTLRSIDGAVEWVDSSAPGIPSVSGIAPIAVDSGTRIYLLPADAGELLTYNADGGWRAAPRVPVTGVAPISVSGGSSVFIAAADAGEVLKYSADGGWRATSEGPVAMAGDVTGTSATTDVVSARSGELLFSSSGAIQCVTGATTCELFQAGTSGTPGQNVTIAPQVSTNGNGTSGNFEVNLGAPTGSGAEAAFELRRGGTLFGSMHPTLFTGDLSEGLFLSGETRFPTLVTDVSVSQTYVSAQGTLFFFLNTDSLAHETLTSSYVRFNDSSGKAVTIASGNYDCNSNVVACGITQDIVSSGAGPNLTFTAASTTAAGQTGGSFLFTTGQGGAGGQPGLYEFNIGGGGDQFLIQTSGVSIGPISGGAGSLPLQFQPSTIGLGATGTTTVSAAQSATPDLILSSTSQTGDVTLDFSTNGVTGWWYADVSGVVLNTHSLIFKNGTGTCTYAVTLPANHLVSIATNGTNKIACLP